ncbi:MAG: hypothetical protein ACTSUJ_05425 [Candidatus Njordarchaeales archaeon]
MSHNEVKKQKRKKKLKRPRLDDKKFKGNRRISKISHDSEIISPEERILRPSKITKSKLKPVRRIKTTYELTSPTKVLPLRPIKIKPPEHAYVLGIIPRMWININSIIKLMGDLFNIDKASALEVLSTLISDNYIDRRDNLIKLSKKGLIAINKCREKIIEHIGNALSATVTSIELSMEKSHELEVSIDKEIIKLSEMGFIRIYDLNIEFPIKRTIKLMPNIDKESPTVHGKTLTTNIASVEMKTGNSASLEINIDTKPSPGGPFKPIGAAKDEISPWLFKKIKKTVWFIDRPVIIVLSKRASDSYIHAIALICREIYRIVKGGKPTPRWLSKGSREEIEECMRAGDMIFIIDDEKCEMLPNPSTVKTVSDFEERIRESKLFDRLYELFSQGFGFIIFHINEEFKDAFLRMLRDKIGKYVEIIEISPLGLLPKVRKELAKICWGFVNAEGKSFDELFGSAEKNYYETLIRAEYDIDLLHRIKRDKNASQEHEALKILVAEAIAKELGATKKDEIIQMLDEGVLKTEHLIEGGRADIYVPQEERYVEIETLYGTGNPLIKLDKETLNKYKGKRVRVDVVLLGLHMLLFFEELLRLKKIYREEHDVEVNFYTIDVKERRLVSLQSIFFSLRELSLHPREGMNLKEAKRAYEYLFKKKLTEEEVKKHYLEDCERCRWKIPAWCLQ